jgi:hypothetical protein
MDDQGGLVEDWGTVQVQLSGAGLAPAATPTVQASQLDDRIPAAQAQVAYGPVSLTLTAFRGPAWPDGLDVLTARVQETSGKETPVQLALNLPANARLGSRTVTVGNRIVMTLPPGTRASQENREWGWDDDAVSLPGWAKPATDCDPAFRNIRAGLHGVPIFYQFKVEPKAACNVVLGFCESHWAEPGQRPLVCRVEGAPLQEVDPVGRWGQHQPGALLFQAKDENGDGKLDLSILPKIGATDQNPILNVIWIFPPGPGLNLDQVIKGRLNSLALHHVDVGGEGDQSLYAGGKLQYALTLPPNGTQELTFLVANKGASAPAPDKTAWTTPSLRQAAAAVWRDWPNKP